jgi:DNA-binding transcriptional ArsR family regulator
MRVREEHPLFFKKFDRLEIEVSPASELILSLFSAYGARSETHPTWSRSLIRKLSPAARKSLKFFFEGEIQLGLNSLRFLLALKPPRSLDALLTHLSSLTFTDFVRILLSKVDPVVPLLGDIIFKIFAQKPLSEPEKAQWDDFAGRYSRNFVQNLKQLVEGEFNQISFGQLLSECWTDFFQGEYLQIFPLLEKEAAKISSWADLRRMEFLSRIAPGLSFSSNVSEKSLTVSPTFYGRPYFFTQESEASFLLIVPALSPEESLIDSTKASLFYAFKSLGDLTRIEILRLLNQRPMYAMEIARALSLSHPTVLHHLASLRAAGFVESELREGNNYYRLIPARWEELYREFREFLTKV